MSVLSIAGFGVFVTGLVVVAFGIPIKEFSFGDTMIVSGAVVSCTGLIMVSLSVVVRELQKVADQLGSRDQLGSEDRFGSGAVAVHHGGVHAEDVRVPIPPGRPIADSPPLADGGRLAPDPGSDLRAPSVLSQRRQGQAPDRDRVPADRDRATVAPVPDAEFPASSDQPLQSKPRRNLLFASMVREREQGRAERSGPSMPAVHAPDSETPKPASRPATRGDQPAGASDRNVSPATVSPTTVLRSGVVNGMAYSLYSDGAIDAQLPEGVVRFASIDQLRAHLDQGSGRSSP